MNRTGTSKPNGDERSCCASFLGVVGSSRRSHWPRMEGYDGRPSLIHGMSSRSLLPWFSAFAALIDWRISGGTSSLSSVSSSSASVTLKMLIPSPWMTWYEVGISESCVSGMESGISSRVAGAVVVLSGVAWVPGVGDDPTSTAKELDISGDVDLECNKYIRGSYETMDRNRESD